MTRFSILTKRVSFVLLLLLEPASAAPPAPVEVPVVIDHGNAIVPVVGGYDGYAALPPDLVSVSVPFAKGRVRENTPLAAIDSYDNPLPTQTRILSKWPDETLRWVRVSFESHLNARKWSQDFYSQPDMQAARAQDAGSIASGINVNLPWDYRIRPGVNPPKAAIEVVVAEKDQKITIDNGRIVLLIDPESEGFGFSQIQIKGTETRAAGPLSLQIIHANGTQFSTKKLRAQEVRIEEKGPLRAVVFLRGRLGSVYEWQTRLVLQADEPAIRAEHTLGGLGDREIDLVDRIYLEYPTSLGNSFPFRAAGSTTEFSGQIAEGESLILDQTAPTFSPASDFAYALSIQRTFDAEMVARGGRSDGWLRCEGQRLSAGVALRNFSEKGPKRIRVSGGGLFEVDLWPQNQTLKLSRARAITHEALYSFYPTPELPNYNKHWQKYRHTMNLDLPYRAYVRPVVPVVDPEYMSQTQAFGPYITMRSSKLSEYEQTIQQNFENWYARHFDRSYHFGMLNYGDYVAPWPGDNGGNPDRPHWRDEEWEFASGLFLHYVRRGDPRAFQAAVAAYRHFMDVDVHYSRKVNFYHSYGDRGEMHEIYYGPDFGHFVCRGLIDAFVLTGDPRALEVAKGLAENAVITFNQGDSAIRQLFEKELRRVAWPTLGLLRLYEITNEPKYLQAASKVIDLMKRDRRLWMLGGSWQSALMSATLEDYHRLTGESAVRDLFLEHVNWLLDSYYVPELKSLGKPPEGPPFGYGNQYLTSGAPLVLHAASLGYAYQISGKRYYLKVASQLLGQGIRNATELRPPEKLRVQRHGNQTGATRSDGKWFSLLNFYTHRLPTAFNNLNVKELDEMMRMQPARQ